MRTPLKIISWNLLRLTGAAVEDVAALARHEKPDVLLMQEATREMEALPSLLGGHFHRLSWLGRIHGLAVWSPHRFAVPRACRCRPRACPAACRGGARRSSRSAT